MYKVKANGQQEFEINFSKNNPNEGSINGEAFAIDKIEIEKGGYHVLRNHQSYNVELVKIDEEEKTVVLMINGKKYSLNVKDKFDLLLKDLGFENTGASKMKELKAPMPGLVLQICVEEGQAITKGSPVVILEAMKMENVLKAAMDGVVKKINIKKGQAVEKNFVLVSFE